MANTRPEPRNCEVLARTQITPNMLRITLGGEGLSGFPANTTGGYIKLRLPPENGKTKPIIRTYTIRAQDETAGTIDVDFVLHRDVFGCCGPATDWAAQAQVGDMVEIAGPGPAKPLVEGFETYVVAGDMSALPAISINLEALPDDATGYAVIEIQEESDKQNIPCPKGVELEWLINPKPGSQPDLLTDRLRARDWAKTSVYAWVASEFGTMRSLRDFFREEKGLGSGQLYISSYWKAGSTEEVHKLAKREDAEKQV